MARPELMRHAILAIFAGELGDEACDLPHSGTILLTAQKSVHPPQPVRHQRLAAQPPKGEKNVKIQKFSPHFPKKFANFVRRGSK
jgi:hypothetical protein